MHRIVSKSVESPSRSVFCPSDCQCTCLGHYVCPSPEKRGGGGDLIPARLYHLHLDRPNL